MFDVFLMNKSSNGSSREIVSGYRKSKSITGIFKERTRFEDMVSRSGPRGSLLHNHVKKTDHPRSFSLGGLFLPNLKGVTGNRDHRNILTSVRPDHRALTFGGTRISQVLSTSEFVDDVVSMSVRSARRKCRRRMQG